MKRKIIYLVLVLFMFMFNVQKMGAADMYSKKIPTKFKKECFEYHKKYKFNSDNNGKNKIIINKADAIAVRGNYLIPIIPYASKGMDHPYTSKKFPNTAFLKDGNLTTFLELDTGSGSEIVLDFNKTIKRNTFKLQFKHSAENYFPEIFISDNNKGDFQPVSFSGLYSFDVKKIKIVFTPKKGKGCLKTNTCKRERIQIKELNVIEEKKVKLIKVQGGGDVNFYSGYKCLDFINLHTIHIPFDININTPTVKINLEKNKNFNPNIEKDNDGDSIENSKDNCASIFNPLQKDSNGDGIGDKCSDTDKDGIIGGEDNCPTLYNPKQIDKNLNKIGDVCEFDRDKDGIFDSVDNCTTTKNALQKDTDKDGIGDMCDNCDIFNPSQIDRNKNKIGDVCDKHKKYVEKNDDDFDGIINKDDNCPKVKNVDQKDGDKDGVGDICDNCKKMKNSNQLDFNKNKVGDLCEDSDGDGIEGLQDNCINVSNPKQEDSNNDGIGNLCEDKDGDKVWFALDNCPYDYNPHQRDTDKDKVGDACDQKDNRVLESNKDMFIILLVIIIIIFIAGIHLMAQKLHKKKKEESGKGSSYTKKIKTK